jgi:hypothetical protein
MSVDIIKQFNDILSSFLIQLSPIMGSTYSYKFEQLIKYNSSLPIDHFIVHFLPLREKILNRDESYFTNPQINTKSISVDEDNKYYVLSEILNLQIIYTKLDEESKSNVWDIFHALVYLCDDYIIKKLNI